MKIRRVFASDMRQAIRKVREELGPDAVILSSRNVEGGVEVISAVDYDERVIQAVTAESEPKRPTAFAQTLRQQQAQRPKPAERPRQKLDVRVDDDLGEALSFAEPPRPEAPPQPDPIAAAPAPEPKRAPVVEWMQEPAIAEMRQEIKVLRSLFENQMHLMEWNENARRHPLRATILRQLNDLGLAPDVCRKIADHVGSEDDPERAWAKALAVVAKHTPVTDDDIIDRGGIIAVVGATGVGKTTTVAKLAARFALRHGRQNVALVSTDNFRIGAQDQLRNFARILGVPVHTAANRNELIAVLKDLSDKRLVLIDTAGMSQRDLRLAEQFQALVDTGLPIKPYLVLSANAQLTALNEVVKAFKRIKPVACILTKLDESTSLGGVLTAVLRHQLPVAYLGTGQRVPEDLQPARSDRLIEQARALAEHYRQETDDETLALTFGGAVNAHNR